MVNNQHTTLSDTRASNYIKPLMGVLLPQDVAVGVSSGYNEATGTGMGTEFNGDYVILQDKLADNSAEITTRFLVLERKKCLKETKADKTKTPASPREGAIKKLDNMNSDYGRHSIKS